MKNLIKKRWNKHYAKGKNKRYWHLTIDSLFTIIILTLVLVNTYLSTTNSGLVLGTHNDNDFIIKNIAEYQADNQIENNDTATTTDNQIIEDQIVAIKSTDIKLQSLALYNTVQGEQLGVGPIPPIAGKATTYWIFISVKDFSHDLENVLVSAKLPTNVSLTEKSSVTLGNNISYNDTAREINWDLGNLTKSDQDSIIGLAFEVKLIPTTNQVGSTADLLTNIKISALDSVTSKTITKTSPNITTNLISDKTINSDGTIVTE